MYPSSKEEGRGILLLRMDGSPRGKFPRSHALGLRKCTRESTKTVLVHSCYAFIQGINLNDDIFTFLLYLKCFQSTMAIFKEIFVPRLWKEMKSFPFCLHMTQADKG